MKRKYFVLILAVVSMSVISGFTFYTSTSHHKLGMVFATGSPYDSGSTCAEFACHSGGTTIPSIAITSDPAFGAGNTFIAGSTYTVNIVCTGSYPKYGFDLEILNRPDTSARDQGVFGSPIANCQFVADIGVPTNVTHTAPSGSGNTATFSFTWTPSSDTAFLYCAVLGANFNNLVTGDKPNTTSMVLTPKQTGVPILASNILDLSIFPNPVKDKIHVTYFLERSDMVSLSLYDLKGEVVRTVFNAYQRIGMQEENLDLPVGLTRGIYFLRITTSQGYLTQKIIVS